MKGFLLWVTRNQGKVTPTGKKRKVQRAAASVMPSPNLK